MAKILVVDDEPALISTIGYSLRKEGYDMLTASDGEVALALARRERPDLIVLDLMLPKVDGLEVCRQLRQSELMARTKAMLRRSHIDTTEPPDEAPISLGGITVDVAQRRVTRDGQELALKPREFDLLRFFVQHPGQVFSREQLLDRVWEVGFVGDQPRLGA